MSNNISEYLIQMQNLTRKNLEILKAINQSFYTKAEHLSVNVDEETYIIPSFISLENKINTLQDNFENLVNAPKTGEAAFDFNGNTQTIEMKGFSNTPAKASIIKTDNSYLDFDFKTNHVFKDFCTPQPFVKIDLSSIPTDIQQVNVKKIIPKNANLISLIVERLGDNVDVVYEYSDLYKELFPYEESVDYEEYNTTYDLPIRDNIGYGSYKIMDIIKNWTDDDLDEHYILTLDTLYYYTNNETLQNTLHVGDYLVTSNDICKLLIEDVKISQNQVTVKVMNGGYVDLTTYDGNVDLGNLKYLPNQDWTSYKYLNLPLEEDQYVFVFISPIQRTSHIQSAWGKGILFNVYNLKCDIDGVTYYYKDYYDKFVNNVGDSLAGITSMFGASLLNFTESQYNTITEVKPVLDPTSLSVLEINKHLSNSDTIEEIYGLYEQKQQYKAELNSVQNEINDINNLLSTTDFTEMSSNRTVYEQQLTALNARKKEITANITNLIQEISTAANDTDTPIDNPKYHIRGFYDYTGLNKSLKPLKVKVVGIDVQYRYKNANRSTGTATHIGNKDNIFSDWNQMISPLNKKVPNFEGVSTGFSYDYEPDTTNINEISFNQIDIPITQGETVDVRLRVIYDVGQPFVTVYSDWSEILNVVFPDELKKNITVLDIINDNNDDVNKTKFNSILDQHQVIEHVDDKIVDQNNTYFHNPAHISSGFYTEERRIIPLFDKLKSLDDIIGTLRDEIEGTETDNLTVTIEDNTHSTTLIPFTSATHIVTSYYDAEKDNGIASAPLSLNITNTSNHIVKLFSIIPGDVTSNININSNTRYKITDYARSSNSEAIWFKDDSTNTSKLGPVYNQWLYFRLNSLYNNSSYYNANGNDNKISWDFDKLSPTDGRTSTLYPTYSYTQGKKPGEMLSNITIAESGSGACKIIQPGETISVPLMFKYKFPSNVEGNPSTEKTMSFDIRTSLYKDPINYVYTIKAKYIESTGDKLSKQVNKTKYNPVVVKTQTIQVPQTIKKTKTYRK